MAKRKTCKERQYREQQFEDNKGEPEAVHQRTNNTMAKRKGIKRQTMIYTILLGKQD